jgi:TfoX/Sxy family transcriptional regulator of competence genes
MTDKEAQARAHEIFDPIAAEYVELPDVAIGRMFGSEGLGVRGKIFAFIGFEGGLMLKLAERRTTELEDAGVARRMVMRGRPMREWVTVDADAEDSWRPLIAEAYAFVDGITP